MNNDELQRRLQRMNVPLASLAARDRARHRATLALGRCQERTTTPSHRFIWQGAGVLAVAVACVWAWHVHFATTAPVEDVATDQGLLQQMQALFPRQVSAVVEDNGKVSLAIAQSPEVGSDQPVVVLFRRQGQTIRVLSYSGHKFCLPLDGQKHCFEILAASTGGVILEEEDKAWLAASEPQIAGYSVRAQSLEASL